MHAGREGHRNLTDEPGARLARFAGARAAAALQREFDCQPAVADHAVMITAGSDRAARETTRVLP